MNLRATQPVIPLCRTNFCLAEGLRDHMSCFVLKKPLKVNTESKQQMLTAQSHRLYVFIRPPFAPSQLFLFIFFCINLWKICLQAELKVVFHLELVTRSHSFHSRMEQGLLKARVFVIWWRVWCAWNTLKGPWLGIISLLAESVQSRDWFSVMYNTVVCMM